MPRRHLLILMVGLAATLWGGCRDQHRAVGPTGPDVARRGSDVTLTGEVAQVFGEYVLRLGRTSRDPVLVVLRQPGAFAPGTRITVSGRIRTFRRAELEGDLHVALGPDVGALEGQPCLLATGAEPG